MRLELCKQSAAELVSRIIPQAERRGVNDTTKEAKRIEVRWSNYPGFGHLPGSVLEKIKFSIEARYVEKSLTQKQKEYSLHKLNWLKKGNIFALEG